MIAYHIDPTAQTITEVEVDTSSRQAMADVIRAKIESIADLRHFLAGWLPNGDALVMDRNGSFTQGSFSIANSDEFYGHALIIAGDESCAIRTSIADYRKDIMFTAAPKTDGPSWITRAERRSCDRSAVRLTAGDVTSSSTILAALRFYQADGPGDAAVQDIATNGGSLIALDAAENDELCEQLNRA